MALRVLSQDKLSEFVSGLMTEYEVAGPVRHEGKHIFAPVCCPSELALDYVSTVLPAKKFMLPQRETLLEFSRGEDVSAEAVIEATPRVLFGVHTCDLRGISHLDRAMLEDNRDAHYAARREATVIVGLDDMPDENCFCAAVGCATAQGGYDLFLTPLEGEYVVEVGTERGGELLDKHADAEPAHAAHVAAVKEHVDRKVAAQKSGFDTDVSTLPLLLDAAWESVVWRKVAEEQCWSCGRCNLVCPTCFCYDVNDVVELNLTEGRRERVWDGCLLPEFAAVASGENFREDKAHRLRHRFYRKFQYLYTKYGEPYCTGCGRCARACVPGITIPGVINDLIAESEKEG